MLVAGFVGFGVGVVVTLLAPVLWKKLMTKLEE